MSCYGVDECLLSAPVGITLEDVRRWIKEAVKRENALTNQFLSIISSRPTKLIGILITPLLSTVAMLIDDTFLK